MMLKFLCICSLVIVSVVILGAQSLSIKPVEKTSQLSPKKYNYQPLSDNSMVDTKSFLPFFIRHDTIHLFKTMPNSYQPKQRLPLFCEIEHQLSKLIKRRVKLGVP